jgi:hypothetical protein
MAPHFWYSVAAYCPGCPGECSVRAFSHFTEFDLGDLIALTCAGAGGNLMAASP